MTRDWRLPYVFLAMILTVAITAQPVICCAQSIPSPSRSAAVQPFLDGDADEESRDIAEALSSVLRLMTSHHIVDPATSNKIATYNDGAGGTDGEMSEAASALARAKEHYFAFRYNEATQGIDNAISLLRAGQLNTETAPLLLDAYISKAQIANSNKNKADAQEALKGALSVNPLLDLGQNDYPPSLITLFEQIKKDSQIRDKGSLKIKSNPQGADVFLNGICQGTTPLELSELPRGTYSLKISANKYKPDERSVEVLPGKNKTVRSRLKWAKKNAGDPLDDSSSDVIRRGIDLSNALKVDRLIFVDADSKGSSALKISARTIDAKLGTGLKPVILSKVEPEFKHNRVADMAAKLADQLDADVLKDPARMIDPVGQGDPVILSKRKKPLTRRPLFWGAIGVAVAGAIAGGIAAAMSGGSNKGTVKVSFE